VAPGLPEHAGTGPAPERASTGLPRRRAARLFAGAPWLVVVLAGAVVAGLTWLPYSVPAGPARAVVAALPFWDIRNGTQTVLAHRGDFTEVSPWIYGLAASGRIDTQYDPAQAAAINADITRLRQAGLAVVPTLANITKGNWSYPPVARMLHHPAVLKQQVSAIVALVLAHRYAGIDIDYENLRAADRHAFTVFITDPTPATAGPTWPRTTPPSAAPPTRCGSWPTTTTGRRPRQGRWRRSAGCARCCATPRPRFRLTRSSSGSRSTDTTGPVAGGAR
jgi:hypothetical protein